MSKIHPDSFVAVEFERVGVLVRQGYSKAPEGRPCRLCGQVGRVWLKSVRCDTAEMSYCTACDGTHVVEVK